MKFCFGDMVVVEDNLIGVVLTDWINPKNAINPKDREVKHEVYVRYFREIREYTEEQMERYMVRHKYLEGEEIIWQSNAVNNTIEAIDTPLTDTEKEVLEKLMRELKTDKEYKEGWNTTIGTIIYNTKPSSREKILGVRSYNAFLRCRIYTLEDFFNKEPYEIKRIRNIGKKSMDYIIKEIFKYCIEHNIETKYNIESYKM